MPHGAHSAQIDAVLAPFRAALDAVTFGTATLPLYSNVTGTLADAGALADPGYWLTHMREPVRFAQAMRALADSGVTHFVEIGPHPVLLGMGAECVEEHRYAWLASLRRDQQDWATMLETLQRLYVDGAEVRWHDVDAGHPRRRVALPTYPFRDRSHWMDIVGRAGSAGRASGDDAARWARVQEAARRQSEQGPLDLDVAGYPATWALLERITTAHAGNLLHDAGLFAHAGDAATLDEVLERARIGGTYRHLVGRWLARLADTGVLDATGDRYRARVPLAAVALEPLWTEAATALATNRPLLAYVQHCGRLLGPVLRGEESPLETLFPGGSPELATDLYERSAMMRYVNALAATTLGAIASVVPPGRVLRVLEIGAGTGGTTSSLLAQLPADRVQYTFTDVSELFLERAAERFAAYPFVRYRRFDMERTPESQGFGAGEFDVVVSANAVHASTDLRRTLAAIRTLLAPGGALLLVESTTHLAWFDMTTGLIEGWQHFADDLRGDHPLLAPAQWTAALEAAGFTGAQAYPAPESPASALAQHLLLARAPGAHVPPAVGATAVTDAPAPGIDEAPGAHAEAPAPWRDRVLDALPDERLDVLRDFVRERVMRILRLDAASEPGRNDRLMELGFDSLMAVQLRNQLTMGLALPQPLPATLMFDHPTIDAIAAVLLDRLDPPVERARPRPSAPDAAPVRHDASAVADMSDADIEALLIARLSKS